MSNTNASIPSPTAWLEIVQKQITSLKFGVVQIVVHEGKVVQIEKTEKVRVASERPVS